jgi:hypothetical protein
MGVESSWTDGVIVERVAAARLADGRTAILDFQSVDSIQNDDDVTAMIGQFETAPMASH